jgi:hypothetical protein
MTSRHCKQNKKFIKREGKVKAMAGRSVPQPFLIAAAVLQAPSCRKVKVKLPNASTLLGRENGRLSSQYCIH